MTQSPSLTCLVPLDGRIGPAWLTDQAIQLASTQGLMLIGLSTQPEERNEIPPYDFAERCQAAGVFYRVVDQQGARLRGVLEATRQVDLVMAAWVPGADSPLGFLTSTFHAVLRHTVRPVWVARPGDQLPQDLTVAFHGQRKAFHAVAQAAVLARAWKLPVDILVVGDNRDITDHDALIARGELLARGVSDRITHYEQGAAKERLISVTSPARLLVMGGAGDGPVFGFAVSSMVRDVLRSAQGPVLLCP